MQTGKKTFIVEVKGKGIHEVTADIDKLKDSLDSLDGKLNSLQLSSAISDAFGSASAVIGTITADIDKLAVKVAELYSKFEIASKSTQDKNQEKKDPTLVQEVGQKKEDKPILESNLSIAKRKDDIEEKATKYGESVKYTTESLNIYRKYYEELENLYIDDEDNCKKALEEKTTFEKNKVENDKKIQDEIKKQRLLVKKANYAEEIESFKHLENLDKEKNINDLFNTKLQLKEKENLLKEHNDRITALQTNMIVKETEGVFAGHGYTDVGKTRENYEQIQNLRKENIEATKKEKDEIAKIYDEELAHFQKGTEGYLALENEKQKKLADIDKQIASEQEQLLKNTTDYYNAVAQNITNMKGEFDKYYSAIGGLAKNYLSLEIDNLKENLTETQAIIDKKTAAYKEHKSKVESLEKEAETASGERAIVLQEQIAREMAVRDESLQQQKEAEKEKETIQKKIDQKEKQKQKIDQAQQLATAIADQASSVIKAWTLGPIAGPIMAAIAVANTAIQIAKIKDAWGKVSKKADGGLLLGKHHSQGGMRIEGTNIEVEGDEFVINRLSTRKNMGLISYINQNRRELTADDINAYYSSQGKNTPPLTHSLMQRMYKDGGLLTNLDVAESASSRLQNDKILDAIGNINLRPVVSVVEITDAQQSITSLRSVAGA